MNEKPLLKIDKFTGFGAGGILYGEGFYPDVINGKSIMSEGFSNQNLFTNATTGFTSLGILYGMIGLSTIYSRSDVYQLCIDSSRIYSYTTIQTATKNGQIHLNSQSVTSKPDIVETVNSNILYPSASKIGRGVRGKATGGSTTTIVDSAADFVTLGYNIGDKVTNLKTAIEYTLTAVATTTLTFVANGANTTAANDEYIAWEDDRFDTSLTALPWQPAQTDWVKQLKQDGVQTYFTNGNYLGIISANENTVEKTHKQLPAKHQALCFDTNNSGMLVSADFNGKGVLLFWDTRNSSWQSILELDTPVISLVNYKSGWVYVSGGTVYYTDGYQIQKMADTGLSKTLSTVLVEPASHNALTVYRGFLFCASISSDSNLIARGVYAINLADTKQGWTNISCWKVRNNGLPYCVSVTNRFSGLQQLQIGGEGFLNYIYSGASANTYQDKSLLIYISLPKFIGITGIGLQLSRDFKNLEQDNSVTTRDVQVSVGDLKRNIFDQVQTTASGLNANAITVNGTSLLNNEIGDEFMALSDTYYGERSFITDIANKGTSGEIWSISPSLSVPSPTQGNLKMIRVKKYGRKTITSTNFNEEFNFSNPNSGIKTNKILLEIVWFGNTAPLNLNIESINIYGN